MSSPQSESFLQAYDELADAIFRHCYFRIYDREEAKDLTQEAFIRGWTYVSSGKEVKNLKALLYKIANNLIIDHSRKKKAVSLDELSEHGFDPGSDEKERIETMAESRGVTSLMEYLDPTYREVIVLRFIDGMSPGEIADVLGETENAVSVRLHRALKVMRSLARDREIAANARLREAESNEIKSV